MVAKVTYSYEPYRLISALGAEGKLTRRTEMDEMSGVTTYEQMSVRLDLAKIWDEEMKKREQT